MNAAIPLPLSSSIPTSLQETKVQGSAFYPPYFKRRIETPSCANRKETNSRHPNKRSAWFQLDENGAVSTEFFHYDQHRSDTERAQCWLSARESLIIRCECRQLITRAARSSYYEQLVTVHEGCKHGSMAQQRSLTQARAILSATAMYRGLEAQIASRMQRESRHLVLTVLKQQATLSSQPPGQQAAVVAKTSRFLSKGSRRFAQVLASGDAAVIVAHNQLDALQQQRTEQAESPWIVLHQ